MIDWRLWAARAWLAALVLAFIAFVVVLWIQYPTETSKFVLSALFVIGAGIVFFGSIGLTIWAFDKITEEKPNG